MKGLTVGFTYYPYVYRTLPLYMVEMIDLRDSIIEPLRSQELDATRLYL